MGMFLEAMSRLGSASISLPLAQLVDHSGNIFSTIGVAIPATATSRLAQIGLFDYAVAEKISKSLLESTGKTLTGHWMDCTGPYQSLYPQGVSVGLHRIKNHHFLTDAFKVFRDPNLNIIDFYKHLGTDIVTKNGLPILPEDVIRELATVIGTTPSKITPWLSLNILDVGASIYAISHAGSNLTSIISGSANWGLGYAANTFGVGALEIAVGIQTTNPILISSGAIDIACGTVTAHQYYTQPFFCGVPLSEVLQSAQLGASFGAILGIIEVFQKRESTTNLEKSRLLGERVSTSTILSSMSAISIPLSITTSFGLIGFSLAKKSSISTNNYVKAIPIKAGLSNEIDAFISEKHIDPKTMEKMMRYLHPTL
ncbi:MAG: hypothetical protein O3A14_07835 [Cyanobacteria bacterium]|nr:hypothetical protein [Cyanobacteriota bacterium]